MVFEINLEEHPEASKEQEDYLYDLEYSLAEVLRRLEHFAGDSATYGTLSFLCEGYR